jgi:hypothetical protein
MRRAGPLICASLVLFALFGYVLSFAPVARLNGRKPPERLEPFYEPVYWLAEETALRQPLVAWSRLWGSQPPLRTYADFSSLIRLIQDTVVPNSGLMDGGDESNVNDDDEGASSPEILPP